MTGTKALITELMLALGIVTYKEVKAGHVPPTPNRYVGTGVVFALLGFFAAVNEDVAAAIGLAALIAVAMKSQAQGTDPNVPNLPPSTPGIGGNPPYRPPDYGTA